MKRLFLLAAALLCTTSARADLSGYPDEYSQRPLTLPAMVVSPQVDYSYRHVPCSFCGGDYDLQSTLFDLGVGVTDRVQFDVSTSFDLSRPDLSSPAWENFIAPGLSFLAIRDDRFQLAASVAMPLRMRGPGSLVEGVQFGFLGRINASPLVFVDVGLADILVTSGTTALVSSLSGAIGFQLTRAVAAKVGTTVFAFQTSGHFDSAVFGADFIPLALQLVGSLSNRVDVSAGFSTDLKSTSNGYQFLGGLAVRL